MIIVLAGLFAAVTAWQLNKLAIKFFGPGAIAYLIPLLEEGSKTLWAFYLGVPVFFSHFIFGGIEAIYDLGTSRRNGFSAGIISFLSHMIFGLISMQVLRSVQNVYLAVGAGYLVHMVWNTIVMKYFVRKKEGDKG